MYETSYQSRFDARYWMLGAGALGRPRGMEWGGRREEGSDAFELWCWRRLLRVPWTARRSNLSILKGISPGCSLEGMMLKLKLQYFGHLMWRVDSLEKTLMLGGIRGFWYSKYQMEYLIIFYYMCMYMCTHTPHFCSSLYGHKLLPRLGYCK